MKKILVITMMCVMVSLKAFPGITSVQIDGLTYMLDDGVAGVHNSKYIDGDINIRNYVEYKGMLYQVIFIGKINVKAKGQKVNLPETAQCIVRQGVARAKIEAVPESVMELKEEAFYESELPEDISLPQIYEIREMAFSKTTGVRKLTLGGTLFIVGKHAFSESEIEEIVFEDGTHDFSFRTPDVETGAFFGIDNIKELKLPKWQNMKFRDCIVDDCKNLERVVFPDLESVEYGYSGGGYAARRDPIYGHIIRNCPNLKEVVCLGETPIEMTGIDNFGEKCNAALDEDVYRAEEFTLMDNFDECVLKVPVGSEALYRADPVWGRFKTILGFENGDYNQTSINETVADMDAVPLYYSMQGFPVKKPVKGELYIRKFGAETIKIVY